MEYFTYYKKRYYINIYPIGSNLNKTLIGNLGYYTIKEQGKDNPLLKSSSKKG